MGAFGEVEVHASTHVVAGAVGAHPVIAGSPTRLLRPVQALAERAPAAAIVVGPTLLLALTAMPVRS